MLLVAVPLGYLCQLLGLPALFGYVLSGVILGPSGLNWIQEMVFTNWSVHALFEFLAYFYYNHETTFRFISKFCHYIFLRTQQIYFRQSATYTGSSTIRLIFVINCLFPAANQINLWLNFIFTCWMLGRKLLDFIFNVLVVAWSKIKPILRILQTLKRINPINKMTITVSVYIKSVMFFNICLCTPNHC